MTLHIAKTSLPQKVLAQHIAILGKTRSGKSSVARLLVEDLLERKQPVCIVDPKGDWYGIKLARDGKSPGYPVVIFGGEHGDVPINEHAGAHVAELFATGNRPCLIDLGGWMVGPRTRFWIDFASTLFKLTKGERWLVVDEVHNFCPKGKVDSLEAGKQLHWTNRLASEGLGKGLAMVIASQRPQKVHNDTLTSCETLIAMRVIHPSDRTAVSDWIKGCGDSSGDEVLKSLGNMARGEGWCWSPEIHFGPERVSFPMFHTYDSFRPQTVEDAKRLTGWAEVDLDDVRKRMAATIERAKQDDPKELRRRIAELEKQVKSKSVPTSEDYAGLLSQIKELTEERTKLVDELTWAKMSIDAMLEHVNQAGVELERCKKDAVKVETPVRNIPAAIPPNYSKPPRPLMPARLEVERRPAPLPSGLTKRQQRFLDAAATLSALGAEVSRQTVCAWIGVHPRGGSVGEELKALADAGLINYTNNGQIHVTGKGLDLAQTIDPGEAIKNAKDGLSPRQRKFFEIIERAYPAGVTREAIAHDCNIHPRGGSLGQALARLVGRGLVEKNRAEYRMRDFLVAP